MVPFWSGILSFTLSRPVGTLCPLQKSQTFFKTAWSLELLLHDFFLVNFHAENFSSTNQLSFMLPWQPYNFFSIILKIRISIIFQVLPTEKNFLWDNLLCFGHHKIIRSVIKAHHKSFKFSRNSFCPNIVIGTKLTH